MNYCEKYPLLKDENNLYKSIEIDDLLDLLAGFFTGVIYIGGAWDEYCQRIVPEANELAKSLNLDIIYNYDPKFINVFKEEENLIDCKTLEHKLKYYSIIEKIGYKSDVLVKDTLIPKINVPFFIVMKNGSCIGTVSAENEEKLSSFDRSFLDLIKQIGYFK